MAYTAPTIDASAQTWANLKARGFATYAKTLVDSLTTNAATAAEKTLVGELLTANQASRPFQRASDLVDNYTRGLADKTSTKAAIFDLQLAYASIASALGEIGALVDAN